MEDVESRDATETRPKPRLVGDARDYEEIMTHHEILLFDFFVLCNQAVGESRLSNFRGRRRERRANWHDPRLCL